MDKPRDVAFLDASLPGLLCAVRPELGVERRELPAAHRILPRVLENLQHPFERVVFARRDLGHDRDHAAPSLKFELLAALKPGAPQSGWGNDNRRSVLDGNSHQKQRSEDASAFSVRGPASPVNSLAVPRQEESRGSYLPGCRINFCTRQFRISAVYTSFSPVQAISWVHPNCFICRPARPR